MQGDALRLVYGYVSFVRPSVRSFVRSFVRSSVHSFIQSILGLHSHLFRHARGCTQTFYGYDSFVRLSVLSFVPRSIHSFIYSFNPFQIYIAVYSVMQGDALRLVYGYDSFGNTCNRGNNAKIKTNLTDVPLSGQDMTGKT